ncbi:MAG: hypothetical protein CL581_11805 [Alteromonadaceae bacterium]|nr:hypothetical protein [Alteromonadaceae bacterium]MBH86871.1 hypothetical protein [Alteromonadaceae bacterium]|tara:strand:+ start:21649 stop:22623 length:975 start_codon:yes stop_codon:yes gene_type:complete
MPLRLMRWIKAVASETTLVYLTLLKILVPALIVVKALEMAGFTQWLGTLLAPVMGLMGLPEALSIVWAATLLTNIYTGMVVFFSVAADQPLTVAQITILGTLMVIGHSLPVEGAVARKAGVPWWLTVVLRIGGGLLVGWTLNLIYTSTNWLQQPNAMLWQPEPQQSGLVAWVLEQLKMLITIYLVILSLIALLKILRTLGIERLLHIVLFPLLRLLGIGRKAANTTIIGITLGLSFGAGLLIRDIESGTMSRRDAMLTLCFLGLCHSLIEDTLLVMLLGADLSGILWARLLFAFIAVGLLARQPLAINASGEKASAEASSGSKR